MFSIYDFIEKYNINLNAPKEIIHPMDLMAIFAAALAKEGRTTPLELKELITIYSHNKTEKYPELNEAHFLYEKFESEKEGAIDKARLNSGYFSISSDLICALKRVVFKPISPSIFDFDNTLSWGAASGNPIHYTQFERSCTAFYGNSSGAIAVKPVLVITNNAISEFLRDKGLPVPNKHYEWLSLYSMDFGRYGVELWKCDAGQHVDETFYDLESALDYFNFWKE
ncbi:hypothetical protein SB5439_05138 [Klebsiella variicola]|uniref:hypothetical protein n=1 Tax=Klebsiella variicola TaxID=244366 RepID=UPI00109D1522|nr:hypothetical protein [Klebsiella variicola]VGQ13080.1 hypothetical protein SB5439_05138 [Klebsiella variicola]